MAKNRRFCVIFTLNTYVCSYLTNVVDPCPNDVWTETEKIDNEKQGDNHCISQLLPQMSIGKEKCGMCTDFVSVLPSKLLPLLSLLGRDEPLDHQK